MRLPPRPWVMRVAAVVALASLLIEFGFHVSRTVLILLHAVDFLVVAVFVGDVVVRLRAAPDRRAHLSRHWPEVLLIALLAVEGLTALALARGGAIVRLYVVGGQVYLMASMLLAAVQANERLTAKAMRPSVVLLGSFLLLIGIGTALLLLPQSRTRPWSFVDALFTATSAACVTGLTVQDTGTALTFRGQAVLLALFQIGGLGVVTLAMFVTYASGRTLRLRQMTLMRDLLNVQSPGNLGRFLAFVLAVTLGAELAGAAVLYHARGDLWWAVFHSVSAFCNAGFSLSGDSLMPWAASPQIILAVATLIVLGGIGFPVLLDLVRYRLSSIGRVRLARWQPGARPGPRSRLALHTKLVLGTTALLIVSGAFLFYACEAAHAMDRQGAGARVLTSLFQSITSRTAGFNTVDVGRLQLPTLLLLMLLMAVGASPASTGGGMKTSTVAVLLLTVRSMMRNRDHVEAWGRTIPRTIVNTAVAIAALYGTAVVVVTALLVATQEQVVFLDALFESVSALSTVGLSTGLTPRLDAFGKLVVAAAMLVGRVGPLAILWTLLTRPPALRYEYPEEPVVVS